MDAEPADLSFLAPPEQVADWRLVRLWDAALQSGLLAGLPGTAAQAAAGAGLDPRAARVVLDALGEWGAVQADGGGCYRLGPAAPEEAEADVVRFHARVMNRWGNGIAAALRGEDPAEEGPPADRESWLRALGRAARRSAGEVADAVLARAPGARTVLELGGGHGEYGREFARRGLRVVMQDLPGTVDIVRRWGDAERDGVELFAGDFFEALPAARFDLVFCAGITHTFGASRNQALYRRLTTVLEPGATVAIVTFLRGRPVAPIFAVQMLLAANGGDTHSEQEYRDWVAAAGFGPLMVDDLPGRGHALLTAALTASAAPPPPRS